MEQVLEHELGGEQEEQKLLQDHQTRITRLLHELATTDDTYAASLKAQELRRLVQGYDKVWDEPDIAKRAREIEDSYIDQRQRLDVLKSKLRIRRDLIWLFFVSILVSTAISSAFDLWFSRKFTVTSTLFSVTGAIATSAIILVLYIVHYRRTVATIEKDVEGWRRAYQAWRGVEISPTEPAGDKSANAAGVDQN